MMFRTIITIMYQTIMCLERCVFNLDRAWNLLYKTFLWVTLNQKVTEGYQAYAFIWYVKFYQHCAYVYKLRNYRTFYAWDDIADFNHLDLLYGQIMRNTTIENGSAKSISTLLRVI